MTITPASANADSNFRAMDDDSLLPLDLFINCGERKDLVIGKRKKFRQAGNKVEQMKRGHSST